MARVNGVEHLLCIPAGGVWLDASISLPPAARAIVLFAQGSGSSRFNLRDRSVADGLLAAGFGTLVFDLLTPEEQASRQRQEHVRFDTSCLAARFVGVTRWARRHELVHGLHPCYFGACTGAAAALCAAGECAEVVRAIVCRAGRFELPPGTLARVRAPTLLLVGEEDGPLLQLNRQAFYGLGGVKQLRVLPGDGFLLSEPSAPQRVTELACDWFSRYALREVRAVIPAPVTPAPETPAPEIPSPETPAR